MLWMSAAAGRAVIAARQRFAVLALSILVSCSGDRFETPGPASRENLSRAAQDQITTIALQRILRHIEVADVRVNPMKICVARSAELAKFEAAPAAVVKALRAVEERVVPASECTTQQEEWGRVIYRPNSGPSILIAAHPYLFEEDDRAFVLGSWYVNTMRAQRFVFVFRRENGEWKLDDGSKLGVV